MSTEEAQPDPAAVSTATATEEQDSSTTAAANPEEIRANADKLVAEGKKAIALKQWEEGVAKYADALDLQRQLVGDFDPSMAPLLLSYGKALYELAFSQAGVMGKEEGSKEADDAVREATLEDAPNNSNFVFSADAASDDEDEAEAEAEGEAAGDEAGPSGAEPAAEGEDDDEPEDDFNAAWEVLDVARTIYQGIVKDKEEAKAGEAELKEIKLTLADTYLALGDVSCETENFPQAVQDYNSALELKSALLPASSRALASVHYQLATVLEFTPGKRADALSHVEKALQGFRARKAELVSTDKSNVSEEVLKLSDKEKENEVKDVDALVGDLEVKIEELKAAPPANDLVTEGINHLLGQPAESSLSAKIESGPVNDLTSMVKKKKPKATAAANAAATAASQKVEEVKKVVGEMVDEATAKAGIGLAAAQEAAAPSIAAAQEKAGELATAAQEQAASLAASAQEKLGQAAVAAGEGLKSTGQDLQDGAATEEGEKRKGDDAEEDGGRPAKKARAA